MQGQKQYYTVFVIMFFLFMLTFYKNVIKRDKALKQQKEEDIRHQLSMQVRYNDESSDSELEKLREFRRRQKLRERMREYEDKCYDIHAFVAQPESEFFEESTESSDALTGPSNLNETKPPPDNVVSGPIIYLFAILLLGSLIKATTDITTHLKNKSNEDDEIRRLSLQEYAALKHERRNSKVPFQRRSTLTAINTRSSSFARSFEERRLNPTIPESNVPEMITEPPTPAKPASEIATRPAPLLRRCSVPVFAHHSSLGLRRPSFESFSEDDSSPDVKRRVRMIHRH